MLPEANFALKRVPLARIVTTFVLYALWAALTTWLVTLLTALVHPSGSFWKRLVLLPLSIVAQSIVYIIHAVGHALSYSVAHSMPSVSHWMNGLATREIALTNALANVATQTATDFERLTEIWIPREIHKATARIWHGIDQLHHGLARTRADLRRFERGIDRLLRDNVMPRIRATERAIDVTIPREIAGVRARERALGRAIRNPSRAWVKRIWKYGWLAVGAGLMLKFLVRKFPHLFCRNVTKTAKAICNPLNNILVDLLLGEGLVLFALNDICTTIRAIEGLANKAEPVLREIVTASDDFFDWCGSDLPTAHDRPGYSGAWLPTAHD